MFDILSSIMNVAGEYISIPLVLLLIYGFYVLICFGVDVLSRKQLISRRMALKEIDSYTDRLYGESKWNIRIVRYISLYSQLSRSELDSFRDKAMEVVRKHKVNPFLVVSSISGKILMFIFFFVSIIKHYSGDPIFMLVAITAMLSILSLLSRKLWIFSSLMFTLSIWVYLHLPPEAVLFLMFRWIHSSAGLKVIPKDRE